MVSWQKIRRYPFSKNPKTYTHTHTHTPTDIFFFETQLERERGGGDLFLLVARECWRWFGNWGRSSITTGILYAFNNGLKPCSFYVRTLLVWEFHDCQCQFYINFGFLYSTSGVTSLRLISTTLPSILPTAARIHNGHSHHDQSVREPNCSPPWLPVALCRGSTEPSNSTPAQLSC